jgi:hypothetical protein
MLMILSPEVPPIKLDAVGIHSRRHGIPFAEACLRQSAYDIQSHAHVLLCPGAVRPRAIAGDGLFLLHERKLCSAWEPR